MGYFLSKIVGALVSPGAILLLLLTAGAGLLWTRAWRWGRGLVTTVLLLLGLVVLTPLAPGLDARLEDRFPADPPLPSHIDGIIILGGAIDPVLTAARGQIAFNDAAERLFEAVRLAKAHPEARVLFSGGSADPLRREPREAVVGARALVDLGLDPARLLIEDRSRNTYENGVFSQRLASPQPGQVWVLITSARHMPRSVGVFRRIGWPVIPYPVDYLTGGEAQWANLDLPLTRLELLSRTLHEWFGLAFYRLSGWTDSFFPAPFP